MIQEEKKQVTITHGGKPVIKIMPYNEKETTQEIMQRLKESVVYFDNSTEPVGLEDWEALK